MSVIVWTNEPSSVEPVSEAGLSPSPGPVFPQFVTIGARDQDYYYYYYKRIRPTWMGNETRNTMDSGIEFTDNRYGPTPPQPGGRKRHADEDTLQIP